MFAALGIGVSNIGGPGSWLIPLGEALATLFVVVGVANVLVYAIARGIQLSRR